MLDLILYVLVNNVSVMSAWIILGLTSNKQGLTCHAQGLNTVMLVRLKPATLSLESNTLPLSLCTPYNAFLKLITTLIKRYFNMMFKL